VSHGSRALRVDSRMEGNEDIQACSFWALIHTEPSSRVRRLWNEAMVVLSSRKC
jgi:hypothetical protein